MRSTLSKLILSSGVTPWELSRTLIARPSIITFTAILDLSPCPRMSILRPSPKFTKLMPEILSKACSKET